MEVTALCVTLVMTVFSQLGAHARRVDAEFLIVPTRLQLFEYEPVSFKCTGFDGSTEWSVLRKTKTDNSTCGFQKWGVKNESSCTLSDPYVEDSGEYWCEAGGGQKSNSVNVTVTAGSLILESPVLPVMEGNDVTMSCRNKNTHSNLKAFYKDGVLIGSSSTGEITIHNVSKSDEGFYKCSISGAGESAENRLTVRVGPVPPESPVPPVNVTVTAHSEYLPGLSTDDKETPSSLPTPWIVTTVLLVILLLVVGLLHLGICYWQRVLLYLSTLTPGSGSAEDQTEASAAGVDKACYADVKKKDEIEVVSGAVYYTLDLDDTQQLDEISSGAVYDTVDLDDTQQLGVSSIPDMPFPSEGSNPPLIRNEAYSLIQ